MKETLEKHINMRILKCNLPVYDIKQEKYAIEYVEFINSRPERNLKERDGTKWEIHHIVPVALNGSNDISNLIKLELKEHYNAHLILHYLYGGKMTQAFWQMANEKIDVAEKIITPEEYRDLRIAFVLSISGENNINYGKQKDEETAKKISDSVKLNWAQKTDEEKENMYKNHSKMFSGSNNGMYGRSAYLEMSNEEKKKFSENRSGEKNGMYGRSGFENKTHEEILEIQKRRLDTFNKNKASHKKDNRLRITNGKENKRIDKMDSIPDGWHRGTTKFNYTPRTGFIRITDGKQNKNISVNDVIPDGWRRGQTQINKRKFCDKSGSKNPRAKKVVCVTTSEIFGSLKEASIKIYNKSNSKKITKSIYLKTPVDGFLWDFYTEEEPTQ